MKNILISLSQEELTLNKEVDSEKNLLVLFESLIFYEYVRSSCLLSGGENILSSLKHLTFCF